MVDNCTINTHPPEDIVQPEDPGVYPHIPQVEEFDGRGQGVGQSLVHFVSEAFED